MELISFVVTLDGTELLTEYGAETWFRFRVYPDPFGRVLHRLSLLFPSRDIYQIPEPTIAISYGNKMHKL